MIVGMPYLRAIELLIKDAFPTSKVSVFCEESPVSLAGSAPTIDERSIVDGYCKKEHLVLVRAELWDDLVRAYQQSRGDYSYGTNK